jgi:tetratricopeptide (TPR) repeat protein
VAARVISALLALALIAGCSKPAPGGAALAAGREAMTRQSLREALAHFRAAVAQASDLAAAHVGRGDAAEALGEFDEAIEAYRTAALLAPTADNRVRLGAVAARAGQLDVAAQALDGADGPARRHVLAGASVGAATLAACAPQHWPHVGRLWNVCARGALDAGRAARAAWRDRVASFRFQILVEAGQRDAALALARERGWLREVGGYCEARDVPVSAETAALLAMLLEPPAADCLLPVGTRAADDGLVRLARLMLTDRVERSPSPEVRARAAWVLRYRLPAHDPPRLAESLNVTGWRLQYRHRQLSEALQVYDRAIAADPSFSWPYHNVGRLYLDLGNLEQARRWLLRAVEVNPDHWRAQVSLGVAAHRARRHDDALAAYTRAATMNPDDARTHADIGWVLLETGRETEAVRALRLAVRLDPSLERERRFLDHRLGHDARQGPTPSTLR